jgi:hypothetical protein
MRGAIREVEDTMPSELHRIPDGDPPLRGISGAGPTNQITMRRMTCVDGLEAALAPMFDSLIIYDALFAAQHALIRAAHRTYEDCQKHGGRRNPLGLTKAASRLMEMESKAVGDSVGPLAAAPDPVDPTVGADAAWCARAVALMYADWGLAERPGERDFAAEDVSRFLAELAEGLHLERDADAIAAIDRARDRLEAWRVSGE